MKILLVAPETETNGYLTNLYHHLSNDPETKVVALGINQIWEKDCYFDIYHFQWPEGIFKWKEPNLDELNRLSDRIDEIKHRSKIISTVHNEHPHYRNTENFKILYKIIYNNTDVFIHLGKYSLMKYSSLFPNTTHIIIPHGIYDNLPNNVSKADARIKINLKKNEFVLLSAGQIRSSEEASLLLNCFKRVRLKNKKLIVLQGNLIWGKTKLTRLLKKILLKINRNIIWKNNYINDTDMQYYINAADILFIPRIKPLNSGNVILGLTFGKIVVGPDYGNVGEILKETSNPTFDPKDISSAVNAVYAARELLNTEKSIENKHYAEINWNWHVIKRKHMDVYKSLIK